MYSVLDVRTLYLCLFHIFLVDSSMTEAERILNRIIEGDSDIDLSEDESPVREDETGEGESSDEEDPDEVDEVCRRPLWAKTDT